ncbi:putative disease resistance protein RGA1 [Sesamum angolense]|uniref:Disease resistance protein RGA1 n=1 Tax=Sesamum angolense TaxID=2727404 RepID=A0AAE1VZQ3_9LAMI|nr:putative disease resistance protein RGA1 [Sesamum angolense]
MVYEVRKIRKKLGDIADERLKFRLVEGVVENRFGETLESRETSSVVNELEIYGRDEEKEMIIGKLHDAMHDQDHLSVYAIWGMGGLGKTTLAQIVYNDNRERLRGKRFLLVLDDVWNENQVAWDDLKEVLRCGSKGSVMLVTTRIEKVALMMATIGVYHIGCLSEEDSWFLFRQRAFTTGVEEESHIAIGKAIVKKCGGVPLAIKALGSLMRFKSHESEWLAIKESEIWQLSDDENDIFPALRLSYYNLAPQMRQCFAYCCLFPKDHVMKEKQLIQLWMANGFVPSQGQNDLYFNGHLMFKELVWRSFLQDVEKFQGLPESLTRLHNLQTWKLMNSEELLELPRGLKVMKSLYFLEIERCVSPIDQLKELNLGGSFSIGGLENVSNTEDAKKANLMTKNDLTSLGSKFPNWMSALALKNLKKVSLENCRRCEHLPPLGKLPSLTDLNLDGMHSLKYLDDGRYEREFSRDFSCLEEIKISWCPKLPGLPFLPTLRSLCISGSINATFLGSLTFLTSLTSLALSDIPELAAFPEGFLQNNNALENLRIKSLPITTSSNVLDNLSALKSLDLHRCNHLEFLPEGLKNLGSLETLYIRQCDGLRLFPAATMEHLSSLRYLSFWMCKKLKPLSGPMTQTTALQDLELIALPELKDLPESMQLFSALQSLYIWGCEGLCSLPDWLGSLESLSALWINECKNLSSLSDGFKTPKSLTQLEIDGCPELEKRCKKPKGEYWPKFHISPLYV